MTRPTEPSRQPPSSRASLPADQPPRRPRPPRVRMDPRMVWPSPARDELHSLPLLVPANEVSRLLGVSRKVITRLIARGTLRAIKSKDSNQGRVLVARDSLVAMLRATLCD